MNIVKQLFVIGIITLGLSACGGGSSSNEPVSNTISGLSECSTVNSTQAVVCGTALASDGVTPLVDAEVILLDASPKASPILSTSARGVEDPDVCLTDTAGDYVCLLPPDISGSITLLISLAGFDDALVDTSVFPGTVTEAGSQILEGNISNNWVVIPGSYDGVQVLLAQLKGCTLSDASGNPFDSVNGSPEEARGSADCENKGLLVLDDDGSSPDDLSAFLSTNELLNYDSLFINCDADYATPQTNSLINNFVNGGGHVYFSDLSSSWLSSAFPGKITFAGDETSTGDIIADVTTPGLQSVVGSTIEVEFDLPAWSAISSVASDVTTFVEGDISANSNYSGIRPITVGWRENNSAGCVFYSSYHIEGASQGSAQERAMKYLVQNIASVCQ